MLAFQGAMAVTSLFGGQKTKNASHKIVKAQRETFEINRKAIQDALTYNTKMRAYDFQEIAKSYGENFVRLNESYVDEKSKIKSELDVVADKYASQLKMKGMDNNSYFADTSNKIDEEYQESIRKVNANLMKQSMELTKERTQAYINAYQNYLNNITQSAQQTMSNHESYISKSSAVLQRGSDAKTNGVMNAFKFGADMYKTASEDGLLPSWMT